MTMVQVGGNDIFYLAQEASTEDGLTLVVLNTVTGDSRIWPSVFERLYGRVPMIFVDVTNQGQSTFNEKPRSIGDQLLELEAVMMAAGVTRPVWVGNSAGTALATRAAASLPTAGLVLLSPLFSLGMERRIAMVKAIFNKALNDTTLASFNQFLTMLTISADYLERNPFYPAVSLARLRSLTTARRLAVSWVQTFFPSQDSKDTIENIKCPVAILRGEEEVVQPFTLLKNVIKTLNVISLITLPCGHDLLQEARASVLDNIDSFMELLRKKELIHA